MTVRKTIILLVLPLLLFVILAIPYQYLNSTYLVHRFGCGCPHISESGEIIENKFNANTVTTIVWSGVALIATLIGVCLCRRLPAKWMRVLYIILLFCTSLAISQYLIQNMMWN